MKLPYRSKVGVVDPVVGDESQQLFDLLHGKHYADCKDGRVFSQTTTPLGTAIPIYTSVTPLGCVLWNPVGSGVDVELIAFNAGRASGTTAVITAGLMFRKVSQSAIGTGTQITAFAETTPVNGRLGGGRASAIKVSNAGTCTITAGVAAEYWRNLFSSGIEADATTNAAKVMQVDFDGTGIVEPGGLIWTAANLASVALFTQTLVWKEIPR